MNNATLMVRKDWRSGPADRVSRRGGFLFYFKIIHQPWKQKLQNSQRPTPHLKLNQKDLLIKTQ